MKISRREAAELLLEQNNILILCHASPDGDTLGSGYALAIALQRLGKRVCVKCSDMISQRFAYLREGFVEEEFEPSYIVAVDVADPKLLGEYETVYGARVQLCIDHHGSNVEYAQKLLLDSTAAANTEIIFDVIGELMTLTGQSSLLDRITARALYTGLATDTGCFKYPSTTPRTHEIAAALLRTGFDHGALNYTFFDLRTRERIALEQYVFEAMEYHFGGKCALIALEQARLSSVDDEDVNGISALPRQIAGVEVGIVLKEKEAGVWKASLRSNSYVSVRKICAELGGGGHIRASGCKLTGTLDECRGRLLAVVAKHLENGEA